MSYSPRIFTAANRPDVVKGRRAERKAPFLLIRFLLHTLKCWHQRTRQRTALAALDNRLLDDVGISRDEATREIHKPFWQR